MLRIEARDGTLEVIPSAAHTRSVFEQSLRTRLDTVMDRADAERQVEQSTEQCQW